MSQSTVQRKGEERLTILFCQNERVVNERKNKKIIK